MALTKEQIAQRRANIQARMDLTTGAASNTQSKHQQNVSDYNFMLAGGLKAPEGGLVKDASGRLISDPNAPTRADRAAFSQGVSSLYGAASGVPNTSLSQREQERRAGFSRGVESVQATRANNLLASDFTVRDGKIVYNAGNTGMGTAVNQAYQQQIAAQAGELQSAFDKFKGENYKPEEVDQYAQGLINQLNSAKSNAGRKAIADQLNAIGAQYDWNRETRTGTLTGIRDYVSAAARLNTGALSQRSDLKISAIDEINQQLMNDFLSSPEGLAIAAKKGKTPEELAFEIQQKGFVGAGVDNQAVAAARREEIELANMTPEELAEREDNEFNIRYQEDLANLELDRDKAIDEEVKRQMGGIDFRSEAAKSEYEKIIRATVEADVQERFDDAKSDLDLGLTRSKRNYISQVEQAREKARLKAIEDAKLTSAEKDAIELENFIEEQQAKDPTLKRAYLKNKYSKINQYSKSNELDPQSVTLWEDKISRGEINLSDPVRAFSQAIAISGNTDSAEKLIEVTGDASIAKEMRQAWASSKYGEEIATAQSIGSDVASLFSGQETDTGALISFVNQASEFFPDEWVGAQLRAIEDSPTADPYVKDFAEALLMDSKYKKEDQTEFLSQSEFMGGIGTKEQREAFKQGFTELENLKRSFKDSSAEVFSRELGLDPKTESEIRQLSIEVYGQRAGSKAEYLNPLLMRAAGGESADDIGDSLRLSTASDALTGDFKDAINFASSGLTDEKRKNAINELDRRIERGDIGGARDFLLKVARDSADTETRKQANGRDDAIKSIDAIDKALDDYILAGGDTGLLTGNYEYFQQNVLKRTSDEKLARLANEIRVTIQTYRKAVSGAAFTQAESKDYEDIFPSIEKSYDLNKAKIGSIRDIFNRNQDSFYRRQLGESYDRIYKAEELSQGEITTGEENTLITPDQLQSVGIPKDEYLSLSPENQKFMGGKINKDIDAVRNDYKKIKELGGTIQDLTDYYNLEGGSSSESLIEQEIKGSEGFRSEAYLDTSGIPTVGYGFTKINGQPVKIGDTITQEQADEEIKRQIAAHSNYKNLVKVDLTPEQEQALASFEYNLGSNIWNSTGKDILVAINNNDFKKASEILKKHNKGKDPITGKLKVVAGLTNRRNREAELLTRNV